MTCAGCKRDLFDSTYGFDVVALTIHLDSGLRAGYPEWFTGGTESCQDYEFCYTCLLRAFGATPPNPLTRTPA
jgi:hypothetical protein